jgi:hypothetical protein
MPALNLFTKLLLEQQLFVSPIWHMSALPAIMNVVLKLEPFEREREREREREKS